MESPYGRADHLNGVVNALRRIIQAIRRTR
jgi:hypothetical protein